MSKYLKLFDTHGEYQSAQSSLILPNVSFCKDTPNEVHYNPLISVTSVSLNENTLSLSIGETADTLVATVSPANASDKRVTWSSSDSAVATVDSNGVVTAVATGNCNIIVTTVQGGFTAQCSTTVTSPTPSHDFVEIGGIKWATMNIGAESVTDYGLYFQWGDISGYTAAQVGSGEGQKYFGWADYKYGNGSSSPGATGMTKYNATDGLETLESGDDAAQAAWGGSWRMPTTAEFQALGNAVNRTWTSSYNDSGVAGVVCTDKTDSSKVLFFPVAGYCFNGSMKNVGIEGHYLSSSLSSSGLYLAYYMLISSIGSVTWQHSLLRCHGFSVRGVAD